MDNVVSSRVTSTIIKFFLKEKKSSYYLINGIECSEENLTDPNNWVTTDIVNKLFDRMEKFFFDPNIAVKIGLAGSELGSWGACDYILRLIGEPDKIYSQVKRFGQYFYRNIELNCMVKKEDSLVVECRGENASQRDFKFIQGALAGIHSYWNLDPAESEFIEPNIIKLTWQPKGNFFGKSDSKTAFSPKLIQEVINQFEDLRVSLERKNIEIDLKNKKLIEFNCKIKELEHGGGETGSSATILEKTRGVFPEVSSHIDKSFETLNRMREYLTSTLTIINWYEQFSEASEVVNIAERTRFLDKINRLKGDLEIENIRDNFAKKLNIALQEMKQMKKSFLEIKDFMEVGSSKDKIPIQ